MKLNTVEELVADIAAGKMVILMDDEDRENEGDLVMAACKVRPDDINFMARFGRGLICLPMTREHCEQLNLPLMSRNNGAQFSTNFTVSIEAAEGVTTGISAADRARTIQAAVAPDARPEDIVQPGHIFPIMAQEGGVLSRAGHTEASCDLARLAGLNPAAVIVEILNEDGTMARRPDLEKFAAQHDVKIGTIADLIEYRALNEKSVQRIDQREWPTNHGEFQLHTFQDTIDEQIHFALTMGDVADNEPVIVRVHVADMLADVLGGRKPNSASWPLDQAMQKIADAGRGVLVLLAASEANQHLLDRIKRMSSGEKAPRKQSDTPQVKRRVGIGSQILAELGVHKMRLLSRKTNYPALSGFKLEVVEYIEP